VRISFTTEIDAKVLGILDADLPVTVTLDVGNGTGTIDQLACGDPQQMDVDVATSAVSTSISVSGTVSANLGLISGDVATVDLGLDASHDPSTGEADFVIPPSAFGTAQTIGSGSLGLEDATVSSSKVTLLPLLGLPISVDATSLVKSIQTDALDPVLSAVDTLVSGPLQQVLGITAASADVTPLSISCSGPHLAG
jgi:uncharacterized membrane protein